MHPKFIKSGMLVLGYIDHYDDQRLPCMLWQTPVGGSRPLVVVVIIVYQYDDMVGRKYKISTDKGLYFLDHGKDYLILGS